MTAARALLRHWSLPHVRRRPLRVLLGFVAVALGVALFVSSEAANSSVAVALEKSSRELAGRVEWQVTRGRSLGIEAEAVEKVRALPGAIAVPVVQASAVMIEPARDALLVVGADFASRDLRELHGSAGSVLDAASALATLALPDAILLARPFAERHGLRRGDKVLLQARSGRHTFTVTGVIEAPSRTDALRVGLAVVDIDAAQRVFREPGRVDRIDVAGAGREAIERALPGSVVEPAGRPDAIVEDALARIRSLVAISVIALLVGAFLVYETVAVSVVERLKEIGTLRALGALRGDVRRALLGEWCAVGLLGSAAGVAAGWALTAALVDLIAATINALGPIVVVDRIVVSPFAVAAGMAIGTGTALAAAWLPVRSALALPPVAVLRAHSLSARHSLRPAFRAGLLLLVLGALLVWALRSWMTAGLVSTAVFFLGLGLVLPQLTVWIARLVRPGFARLFRVEGFLAADNAVKFPQRTALTVIALGGSLAMLVASATLIEGFRTASSRWLDDALPFDLAVSSTDFTRSLYGGNVFPAAIQEDVRAVPAVAHCYGVRAGFCEADGANVMCIAIELRGWMEAHRRRGEPESRWRFRDPAVIDALAAGRGVVVSENFAELYGKGEGDTVTIATREGPRVLPVLAAVEDYSWPRGVVFLDRAAFGSLFGDTGLTYVDVVLRDGVTVEEARTQLVGALQGTYAVYVFAKEEILGVAGAALDQMMALANAQVLLALVIGFLGILNTLWLSVLHRTREIGLLRAIGMSRGQVARTIVAEALLTGAVAGACGVAVGLGGGWGPLRLFTLHLTGYLPPAVVPWPHVGAAVLLALAIAACAALLPARRAARLPVLDAIGYE